jgi:hypothetical protein
MTNYLQVIFFATVHFLAAKFLLSPTGGKTDLLELEARHKAPLSFGAIKSALIPGVT